jgi:tetratricopeptide (TPR) repeat protein
MDDPREVADAAYNLAACLIGLNQLDRARSLLHEAEWDLGRIGGNTDDAILLEAKVLRQQGKLADAQALTDRLIAEPRPAGSPGPAIGVYILRGRLALERHDVAKAKRELATAQSAFKDGTDASMAAGIAGLSGRIALEESRPADAAQQFDAQTALLQKAGFYSDMSWALSHAGDAYLVAGRPDTAADRLYRAARCAYALGNTTQAHQWIDRASEAADAAKLPDLSGRIQNLKDEMSAAATQPSAATLPSLPSEATKQE